MADNSDVQFCVALFESGEIEFRYNAGNANLTPTVGVSAGDGRNYRLASYDGAGSLGDASPLRVQVRCSPSVTSLDFVCDWGCGGWAIITRKLS